MKIGKKAVLPVIALMVLMLVVSVFGGCAKPAAPAPAPSPAPAPGAPAAPAAPAAPVQNPVEFTLAHMFPATHLVETGMVQGWANAVEEATDGLVKIVSFPVGTLIPPADIYQGVVDGVADIGIAVYAYNRGRFPFLETFLVPGIGFNNSKAASMAVTDAIKKYNPQELQDTKQLWTWGAGPGDLMTKTPIRTMEDLKGLEIGTTAGPRAKAIELLGGVPVTLPMPEWYEALSRGVAQGGVAPIEVLQGYRLSEVTGDYITLTPFLYNQLFFCVMNNDKWNALTPDTQQKITEATDKFYKEFIIGLWDDINEKGLAFHKSQKNVEIITLSEAETKRWVDTIAPVAQDHLNDIKAKGLPADEIYKTIQELADKYNKMYPN